MKHELDVTITESCAAKEHVCDYCNDKVLKGTKYVVITSRKVGKERFPVTLRVCNKHDPKLLPISLLLVRKK